MNKKEYINYNGKLVLKNANVLPFDNRGFKYGDALFENMRAAANKVRLFEQHLQRLVKSMEILNMEVPDIFDKNKNRLLREINTLTNKNLQFKGSEVILNVFRNYSGSCIPESNAISYIVESKALPTSQYELNKQGLLIDVYEQHLKPINVFSTLQSGSSLLFTLAGIFAKQNNLDQCLISNERGNIIECIDANIFVVKNAQIYTPPLSEACLPGIMRQNIIELSKSLNIEVEYKILNISDFEQADEVFLSNSVAGIQWVVGFRHRRYYNRMSKKINDALNLQLSSN